MSFSGQSIETIREFIQQLFQQAGAEAGSPTHEALLIRNGYYCGRKFERDGLQAIWFIEEHQIKLYGQQGHLQSCPVPPADSRVALTARAA
jgi:hypothetical protein